MAYDRLDPIGGRRLDLNTAYIVQTLWNLMRGKEDPQAPDLGTIALRFGLDAIEAANESGPDLGSRMDAMMGALAAKPTPKVVTKPRGR